MRLYFDLFTQQHLCDVVPVALLAVIIDRSVPRSRGKPRFRLPQLSFQKLTDQFLYLLLRHPSVLPTQAHE